ncbi:hypothetical protein HBN50_03880 [Halobacteriovorax sp. GB3]|uniref:hypothetical protein n=1 Tax=Halobacteriovorax sp. GB3 TaxID=2719615 RepID=UPI0023623879|nr:hypothetical protein [Halobacteriovorax sp. GB3]MDD0852219.1 hypothetical protein [Halobacteriovorax sp. GB3]
MDAFVKIFFSFDKVDCDPNKTNLIVDRVLTRSTLLDYQNRNPFRNNELEGDDSQKALSSYSDLFVAISFVFLFLFIVANIQNSLHQIMGSIQREQEKELQKKEVANLEAKQQKQLTELIQKYERIIATYQTEKEDYINNRASKSELAVYQQALSKLKLIEQEKKQKKEEYEKLSKSFATKEAEYQNFAETLNSIINANMAIKGQIAKTVHEKEKLEKNLNQYKQSFKKKTLAEFDQDYKTRVADIEKKLNAKFNQETENVKKQFKKRLKTSLSKVKSDHVKEISLIQNKIKKEKQKIVASYTDQLSSLEAEKIKLKKSFEKQVNSIKNQNERKIASLESEHLEEYEKQVQMTNSEKEKIANLEKEFEQRFEELKGQKEALKKKQEFLVAKNDQQAKEFHEALEFSKVDQKKAIQDISKVLSDAFKANNIDAIVDGKTGEVSLNFDEAYFEMGSHKLNKAMKDKISKVIPTYARALFDNPAIITRIGNFEIVGFSSPVFGKKFVNPKELSAKNYWPLNYNMDLSYKRARSVFKYVFNPYEVKDFDKKQEMFQMTKVSGRSYLEGRVPAQLSKKKKLSWKKYCEKYNCKGQQKVVIKFNLKY